MPKLTIQIVGWNSAAVLPATLQSLSSIPREAVVIRYIDNASRDGSAGLVGRSLPQAEVICLPENQGFAGAHNRGLARCTTPYVLILNPDARLLWAGVEVLRQAFADEKVGAAQGKIYRDERRRILDSCGIIMTKALNGIDRGAGEIDTAQYNQAVDIAAVTGAAGLYRLAALRAIAHGRTEIFDEDFFAYKEDVDVGWRLRRAGWRIVYWPFPVAIHTRAVGAATDNSWRAAPRALRRRLRDGRTFYSLRNWVWMLLKNLSWREELRAEVFIDARLLFFCGLSLLYWPLLRVWPAILRGAPKMLEKRRSIS